MNRPLKYQGVSVVFQEVPDEISLAFNIADCPHKCRGCHSALLFDYAGKLLSENYVAELDANPGATCACFMGGEWRPRELTCYSRIAHRRGMRTCLYTGAKHLKEIDSELLRHLDYIKFGPWDVTRGPLSDPNTNQRMFMLRKDKEQTIQDITSRFLKYYE